MPKDTRVERCPRSWLGAWGPLPLAVLLALAVGCTSDDAPSGGEADAAGDLGADATPEPDVGPDAIADDGDAATDPSDDPTADTGDDPVADTAGDATGDQGELPGGPVTLLRSALEREDPDVPAEDLARLVRDHTDFALALHRAQVGHTDGDENLVFSPYSISTAFSMVWPGTRGVTADEIADGLRFGLEEEAFHQASNRLARRLAARNDVVLEPPAEGEEPLEPPTLRIVNDVWALEGYPYVPAYLDLLARHYGAGLWIVDFVREAEAARLAINDYIAALTNERIEELLPADSITALTRLVLTNAIYFKAGWRFTFDEDLTAEAVFTRLDGSEVTVDRMRLLLDDDELPHALVGDDEVIELPYLGEELSMVILLPAAGTFASFEQELDVDRLEALLAALELKPGRLDLPRFEMRSSIDLVPLLQELGIEAAFEPALADFSGLSESTDIERLFISGAFHEGYIAVDEQGTEAAGATAVVIGTDSEPTEWFDMRVDRPFLFLIRDRETGVVLFMGRVVDPTAE
jgi:serpin B